MPFERITLVVVGLAVFSLGFGMFLSSPAVARQTKKQQRSYQFAEKGFRGVPMGNIDSRPVCATHERFATIRLWIRILRIARPISSFSANC